MDFLACSTITRQALAQIQEYPQFTRSIVTRFYKRYVFFPMVWTYLPEEGFILDEMPFSGLLHSRVQTIISNQQLLDPSYQHYNNMPSCFIFRDTWLDVATHDDKLWKRFVTFYRFYDRGVNNQFLFSYTMAVPDYMTLGCFMYNSMELTPADGISVKRFLSDLENIYGKSFLVAIFRNYVNFVTFIDGLSDQAIVDSDEDTEIDD